MAGMNRVINKFQADNGQVLGERRVGMRQVILCCIYIIQHVIHPRLSYFAYFGNREKKTPKKQVILL